MSNAAHLRRTKIVATLGPASQDPGVLARMIQAGMDVARFNLSHGSADDHRARLAALREAVDRLGLGRSGGAGAAAGVAQGAAARDGADGAESAVARRVGVLFDLRGPEIRIGTFAGGPVTLAEGATFTITTAGVPGTAERVSVEYPAFPSLVRPRDTILLDDGNLALEVLEVLGGLGDGTPAVDVVCRVKVGGPLSDRKKINLPGRHFDVPFLSPKDQADLRMAVEAGADFIAASFVRQAADVIAIRRLL